MEEFLVFFLGIFVFFTVINKVYKKGDIITVKSSFDQQNYIVRKLPDAKDAANKLAQINKKILKIISSVDRSKPGSKDLINKYNPHTLSDQNILLILLTKKKKYLSAYVKLTIVLSMIILLYLL